MSEFNGGQELHGLTPFVQVGLMVRADVAIDPDAPVAMVLRSMGDLMTLRHHGDEDGSPIPESFPSHGVGAFVFWSAGQEALELVASAMTKWLEERLLPVVPTFEVESSNIAAIGWGGRRSEVEDRDGLGVMCVEFLSGDVYAYDDVPMPLFQEFWEADSKGSFFSRVFRQGPFPFRKLVPVVLATTVDGDGGEEE